MSSAIAEAEIGVVVIGKGTRVQGKIGDCSKLDVYGILEADAVADIVVVRSGGGIKGTVHSRRAEVHGVIEGTLVVEDHLEMFRTGTVTGDVSYRTIAIETGAKLRGNIICSDEDVVDYAPASPIASNVVPMTAGHVETTAPMDVNGFDHRGYVATSGAIS